MTLLEEKSNCSLSLRNARNPYGVLTVREDVSAGVRATIADRNKEKRVASDIFAIIKRD